MAKIYPFRGYRYNLQGVGDIAKVVTQPYDKISTSLRDEYLQKHPANIVRVIKNENYAEAGELLKQWCASDILVQDREPALYPYCQDFEYGEESLSRIGFIGLVSLQDQDLSVKGHENILEKPLQDRLSLIRETESNEGLIFSLYSDSQQSADRVLESYITAHPPVFELIDEYGVRHRLWKCADQEVNQEVISALSPRSLYIADGHHRFQTSVLFHRQCLPRGWKPSAVESFDKRMMAFFNMESRGLRILPTHRAIRNLSEFHADRLLERLTQHFVVERCADLPDLNGAGGEIRIGLVIGHRPDSFVLKLKKEALASSDFMSSLQGPSRSLDVNVLHEGILHPILGIGSRELSEQKYVDYFREISEMMAGVRQGRYQAAFLLNPTTLQQVREISERGEKMPQKSTDFFPKLLTGLVLMKMAIDKGE